MLANILKQARAEKRLRVREIAHSLDLDQALISKYENGVRVPTYEQLERIAHVLDLDLAELKVQWLADKIVNLVQYEPHAKEVLAVAESRVEYLVSTRVFELPEISDDLKEMLDEADYLKAQWKSKKPLEGTQL